MSRCRCSDITSALKKIEQLESALEIQQGYYTKKESRDKELLLCAVNAEQAIISARVVACRPLIISLGNEMDMVSGRISARINSRLTELRSDVSNMRSEDSAYHEEQRRIREATEAAERAEREAVAREAAAREAAAKEVANAVTTTGGATKKIKKNNQRGMLI